MRLVIAEKDALARDIARAICGAADEHARMPIEGRGYAICACSGHLLELMEPSVIDPRYAACGEEGLPIAVYPWPKAPRSGSAERRLAVIGRLLGEGPEAVYHAGDADDEGQLIVDEVLEHFGWDPADPRVLRVYVNDSVEQNIRRAFEGAVPNAECIAAGKSALARSLADMCFGVSESRLAASRMHAKVAIGRVQTPTLGLVVARDRQREGHAAREHYALQADVAADGGSLSFRYAPADEDMPEDGKHVFDRALLERYAGAARGKRVAFEVSMKRTAEAPPLPYSMTTLTADLSRRFGLTASDAMEATQRLRDELGAITYNRSNTCYLKDAHLEEAPATAPLVASNIGCTWELDTSIRSAAFDDAKLAGSPHHAIIPTAKRIDASRLAERERTVYEAITERYLAQFLPQAVFEEARSSFRIDGVPGTFEHASRVRVDAGWQGAAPAAWARRKATADGLPAPGAHAGEVSGASVSASTTAPPKPFTDGTLISAMSNVARYAADEEVRRILIEKDKDDPNEHGSIGTTATRSRIIEGLIERGYLVRKGKALVSTDRGRALYDAVPEQIRGVDLTARWWLIQQEVAAGTAPPDAVMRSVCREFEAHRADAYIGKTLDVQVGQCPRCGSPVIARGRAYTCSSNRSEKGEDGAWHEVAGCGFKVLPFAGKHLSAKQAASLLAGKKVRIKGAVSKKTGKRFDCSLVLDAGSSGGCKPIFDSKAGKDRGRRKR